MSDTYGGPQGMDEPISREDWGAQREETRTPLTTLPIQEQAKFVVMAWLREHLDKTDNFKFKSDDVYVVWWCKTLQNWKALVSTTLPDGMYYEVTYSGDMHEIYLDAYKKFQNVVFPIP